MNIVDYILEYGNKTIEELSLTDVDSLILSQVSYFKFEDFTEDFNPLIGQSLCEMSQRNDVECLFGDERYAEANRELFFAAASSKRFGSIVIKDFVNITDDDWKIQFAAMRVLFPDGTSYVVFRGTDDNIVGWQEDLDMVYKIPIPAQEKSVQYLKNISKKIRGHFYIGGHSKGGNLAVYSSMSVSKSIQSRIIKIYSHDGPGFKPQVIENSNFENVQEKIIKLVPKSSIVGMLMTTKEAYEVVACKGIGISQHNPFNWIVEGTEFKKVEKVDKVYALQDKAINIWAYNLTDEQGEYLSKELFDLFDKAGITNLNDLQANPSGLVNSLKNLMATMNEVDEETKKNLDELFKMMSDIFTEVMREDVIESISIAKNSFSVKKENMSETLENAKVVVDNVIDSVQKAGRAKLQKHEKDASYKKGRKKKFDDIKE